MCVNIYIKVKVTPWNAYAGTERRRRYSSNPITSRQWEVGGQHSDLTALPQGNDRYCAGGWVGLGVSLDGTEILVPPPRGIHSAGPSSPWRVAILTTLYRPSHTYIQTHIHTHIHTHAHANTHTHIHTYIHTYILYVVASKCSRNHCISDKHKTVQTVRIFPKDKIYFTKFTVVTTDPGSMVSWPC